MKCTLIPAAIGAAILLNTTSGNASAAYCSAFSAPAHRIYSIARELSYEFSIHFRHSADYCHLRSDISRIISEARHIDHLSNSGYASLCHIMRDLEDLDHLAHHLHAVVDRAEQCRFRGHVHGNTRHVHYLLSSLNSSIHYMQRMAQDLNHRERHFRVAHREPRVVVHHEPRVVHCEPRVVHCEPRVVHCEPRVIHSRPRNYSSVSLATGLLRIAFSARH